MRFDARLGQVRWRAASARSKAAALGLACLAALSTGCSVPSALRPDTSIRISVPTDLSLVTLPVTIRWHTSRTPDRATAFAIFLDRAPVPPGASLADVGAGDLSCTRTKSCASEDYLRAHGVIVTKDADVVLASLPVSDGLAKADQPAVHQATVVFLDSALHRVGQSGALISFRVKDQHA